jgi:hypothetical protein
MNPRSILTRVSTRTALTLTGASLLLAVALTASAQPVYNGTPDWISTDTPYSTGGALVDLDHDGWLDLVVGNGNDMRREQLAVYYNNGDGTYPLTPDWLASDSEYNGHISVADVNGDGWLDVAVGLTQDGLGAASARLYLNNNGTLSSLPDWASTETDAAFHVDFGDVNSDGRPDLAVGTGFPYSGTHQWHNYVHLNINGTLEAAPSWVSADTYDYGDILFCDVNRDGWLDLIGVGQGTDTWVYFNNQGTLNTAAGWHTLDNPGQFSVMGTYGDLTGNGYPELFTTDNTQLAGGAGYFRRYDGIAFGFFTTSPTWSYYEGYGSAVSLADFDADGDLDLATGGWWENTRYFLNTGGTLPTSPSWSSSGTSVVEAIVFGDVDQDGRRYPTETFDLSATPGRQLFKLARQPVDEILGVSVDGVPLLPDQYMADTVHGWLTVGVPPVHTVVVRYAFTFKPEMIITNWDDNKGNYLYYNNNSVPRYGDLDDNGAVDVADFDALADCLAGPDNGLPTGCWNVDADLDDDADLHDAARFATAFTGP